MFYLTFPREPFELNVSVQDKVIPYGFDEASRCDALLLHCYMDKTLNYIGKLVNIFTSVSQITQNILLLMLVQSLVKIRFFILHFDTIGSYKEPTMNIRHLEPSELSITNTFYKKINFEL